MYLPEKLGTNCTKYFINGDITGMCLSENRCGAEARSHAQNKQVGSVVWYVDRCTDHHYNTDTRGTVPVLGCDEFLPVARMVA